MTNNNKWLAKELGWIICILLELILINTMRQQKMKIYQFSPLTKSHEFILMKKSLFSCIFRTVDKTTNNAIRYLILQAFYISFSLDYTLLAWFFVLYLYESSDNQFFLDSLTQLKLGNEVSKNDSSNFFHCLLPAKQKGILYIFNLRYIYLNT